MARHPEHDAIENFAADRIHRHGEQSSDGAMAAALRERLNQEAIPPDLTLTEIRDMMAMAWSRGIGDALRETARDVNGKPSEILTPAARCRVAFLQQLANYQER